MFVSAQGGEVCLSLFWWTEYGQESKQFQRQRDARSLGHGHVLWRQKRRPIKAQKEISMCLKSPQSQKAKARVVGWTGEGGIRAASRQRAGRILGWSFGFIIRRKTTVEEQGLFRLLLLVPPRKAAATALENQPTNLGFNVQFQKCHLEQVSCAPLQIDKLYCEFL